MTYKEQIQHPKWQKKRLEILKRDDFTCQHCSDKNNTLHVHHLLYHKHKLIWQYENKYLITYCNECHTLWHKANNELKEIISKRIYWTDIISINVLLKEISNYKGSEIMSIIDKLNYEL